MSTKEVWRVVPSFPGILVSSLGQIMIAPHQHQMPNGGIRHYGGTACKGWWDGRRFSFMRAGRTYRVSRLICEAFNGPPPFPSAVCMHIDEDNRNNTPSNLRWATQKENLNCSKFILLCKSHKGALSARTKWKNKRMAA